MQNNEKSNSGAFRKFFQEKGYYIVLFLCIAAVGISGYIFVTDAISEKNSVNEQTLSVATTTTVPQTPSSGSTNTPAPQQAPASSVFGEDDANEAAADLHAGSDDAVRETAKQIRVWPVSGETQLPYSVDALTYHVTTRDWRTHDGVDLAAVSGEQVKAAAAGTVSAVYDDEYLGTTVVIRHDDTYSTHYSNLAAMPTVSVGDTVSAGTVIGAVGETALVEIGEASHLHFAVYENGNPMDPAAFIG